MARTAQVARATRAKWTAIAQTAAVLAARTSQPTPLAVIALRRVIMSTFRGVRVSLPQPAWLRARAWSGPRAQLTLALGSISELGRPSSRLSVSHRPRKTQPAWLRARAWSGTRAQLTLALGSISELGRPSNRLSASHRLRKTLPATSTHRPTNQRRPVNERGWPDRCPRRRTIDENGHRNHSMLPTRLEAPGSSYMLWPRR